MPWCPGEAGALKGRGRAFSTPGPHGKGASMIERAEELVTVFGGDGFIGRYVCEFLMKSGVRVRVASCDPRNSYFIQADFTNADSARRVIDGTSAAINLVGVFGGKMEAVHVNGARNVAEAAREAGTRALVHISAIGADPQS